MTPKVVGLSGSLTQPSRTTTLVRCILQTLTKRSGLPTELIELSEDAPHIFLALQRAQLRGRAAEVIQLVEQADLLIVGTPVYRASYTGAFKHLFDLVHHEAFAGKRVMLAATGGTALHGLVTEHELRPLFGFLNALTLPTTIYAVEQDFMDYRLVNAKTLARIERAVSEALAQFPPNDAAITEASSRLLAAV
jgi:FMN reductase